MIRPLLPIVRTGCNSAARTQSRANGRAMPEFKHRTTRPSHLMDPRSKSAIEWKWIARYQHRGNNTQQTEPSDICSDCHQRVTVYGCGGLRRSDRADQWRGGRAGPGHCWLVLSTPHCTTRHTCGYTSYHYISLAAVLVVWFRAVVPAGWRAVRLCKVWEWIPMQQNSSADRGAQV